MCCLPAGVEALHMQLCLDNEVRSLHDLTAMGVQSGCIACYEVTPESQGYITDNQNITLVA